MNKIVDHQLVSARRVNSPNHSARPKGEEICLLVIHSISLPPGDYGGPHIDELFCNCLDGDAHEYFKEIAHLKVSSHILIRRDGEVIQYVPFDRKAWHAGASLFEGRVECNDFSIGIELEGTDEDQFTKAQYEQLKQLTLLIMELYPEINVDKIVGHSDIAPGRKTDPGPNFDWQRYRKDLEEKARDKA
jgi:N-acetyl-anhydromuramoyl-L-alanine amidase